MVQQPPVDEVIGSLPVEERPPSRQHAELLDLGAEGDQALGRNPVVQRLDTKPVARRKDAPPRPIYDDERKHAVESRKCRLPPALVGSEQYFGVAACSEARALLLQFGTQLRMVVNLAV